MRDAPRCIAYYYTSIRVCLCYPNVFCILNSVLYEYYYTTSRAVLVIVPRAAHAAAQHVLGVFLKMVVMLSGFVAVPGAQIYYETYTPEQTQQKQKDIQTLMYHHGMTGASSQVPDFARSLCEQTGIRVVLLDSRGCGKTLCDHPTIATQYTQAQMAADLIAVANALGVNRFDVGGQSYGTRVSLYTAAMAKGRVNKVVLVVPPPITSLWGPDDNDAPTNDEEIFDQMRENAVANPSDPTQPTPDELQKRVPTWKRACTAREHLPDALAVREMKRAASNTLNPGFDTYKLQVLIDAQAFPPTESQLAELLANTPVLCVFGGEDRLTWQFLERKQHLILPHCQLKCFVAGGHEVTMELPDECAAAVGGFLANPQPQNWSIARRTEYLTTVVAEGKASADTYQSRLTNDTASPKL